ncbi:hypothetical protein KAU25_01975 [Candidatus Bathyarchaeota archaeon]|nr:hypothetical protein [Candidatus Bathyarchaeota archaeon]
MSGRVVASGSKATLSTVEGDLEVGRRAVVQGEGSPPKISVSGTVYTEDDCLFECGLSAENLDGEGDLTIEGDLEIRNRVSLDDGRLDVQGNMKAQRVDVGKSLRTKGDLEANYVDVGGKLDVGGETTAKKIDVGGAFTSKGRTKAENIDVGGSVEVESTVDVDDIDVGGKVEVSGGKIGKLDVGGSFVSHGPLEFKDIDVGGTVKLTSGSGGNIDVGGSLKAEEDLRFNDIDVGGVVSISGSGEGKSLNVGGQIKVGGDLTLSGAFDVGGIAEVNGNLSGEDVSVGGRLHAGKIVAQNRVSVGGSVETIEGVYTSHFRIGRRGKVVGLVKADEALIGRGARVDDVFAKTMTLEREASAENLYGERIRLERGCRISGEVQYVEDLKTERDVSFAQEPRKVSKLPEKP